MSITQWIIYFSMAIIGGGCLFLIIVIFLAGWLEPHRYKELDNK